MRAAWVTSSICAEFIIRRVLTLGEREQAIYNLILLIVLIRVFYFFIPFL